MKPLTLEMNAFGPFCSKQIIDFSELMGRNIFLITGPTGAGKTTVFDAICFALYGDTSGESRQSDSLKSQFADINEKSYVTFSFEVKGKSYTVTRFPKQQKLGRNGEIRVENSSVRLFVQGEEPLSGIAANKQIEQIIGLSKEQFRKVVMLPQGEFRKLLEDKSDSKQEILRRIFSTQVFSDFTERLKEEAKQALQKTQQINADNKAVLKNLALSQNDEELRQLCDAEYPDIEKISKSLGEKLSSDKDQALGLKKLADRLFDKINKIDLKYAIEINEKFDSLDKQTELHKTLDLQKDEFDKKKKTFEKLNLCSEYIKLAKNCERLKSEIDNRRQEIKNTAAEYENVRLKAEKLKAQGEKLPEYEVESEKLLRDITSLDADIENLKKMSANQKEILRLNSDIFKIQEKILLLDECKAFCEKATAAAKLDDQLDTLGAIVNGLSGFNSAYAEFCKAQSLCMEGYKRFYKSAASVLAKELKDNEKCPVCGSKDHPSPCKDDGEKTVTKQQLTELEEHRDACSESMHKARQKCIEEISKYNANAVQALKEEGVFGDSDIIGQTKANLTAQLNDIKSELSDKKSLIQKSEHFCEQMLAEDYALSERERCIKTESELFGQRKKLSESIANTAHGKSEEELILKRGEFTKKLSDIKKHLQDIRNEISTVNAQKDRLEEAVKRLEDFLAAKKRELSDEKNTLAKFEEKNNLSKAEIKELLPKLDNIQALSKEISDYSERVKICTAMLDGLKRELCGKQRFDTEKLKAERAESEKQYGELNAEYIEIMSRIKQNTAVYKAILKNQQRAGEEQDRAQRILYLAALAKGDNEQKISFERYVLTAYFEEVIEAANQRLWGLSTQRYTLLRKQEKEKNGRGSGLELSVFDAYSGKIRDVTTLSGGESFKAALSLALGMADVISRHAGGVEVDSVFIDEGFGSLDDQSLDSAVSCLMDLQTDGRLVGIISHVELLKERVGAKLAVTPTKNGSSLKFVVR